MDVLNKKNYRAFRERCQGAGVQEIHVRLKPAGRRLKLQYNARDPRSKRMLSGEWVIDRRNQTEEQIAAAIEDFYELAGKEFAITRHEEGGKVVKLEEGEEEQSEATK